jgi:hypothetical protein
MVLKRAFGLSQSGQEVIRALGTSLLVAALFLAEKPRSPGIRA